MLVGYRSSNHPQQLLRRGQLRDVDDWRVHPDVFGPINQRFGGFTVDVAATAENAVCARYYSIEDDGLAQPWAGERVWANPPYSLIRPWVEKAWAEYSQTRCIVMLLPANRTEQGWWQEAVEPYRDRVTSPFGPQFMVEFLPGRLRFLRPGQAETGPNERPPFGCCLLIWTPGYGPIGTTLPKPARRADPMLEFSEATALSAPNLFTESGG